MKTGRFRGALKVGRQVYAYWSLRELEAAGLLELARLPYSLRVLAENVLRRFPRDEITAEDFRPFRRGVRGTGAEIAFYPTRVLLQDFTGVPLIVDLAAMRDAVQRLGLDPARVNPSIPVDLVIDHSVQVEVFGRRDALRRNLRHEYGLNRERYRFLKWAQGAFRNLRVFPPGAGIVHQVNLEHLSRVVVAEARPDGPVLSPESLVGTDSHTTMINGIGVLAWGVGGIEAEAVMLGLPYTMPVPEVVGVRLQGRLPRGATATDLVLHVTERLRREKVVETFVEFYGPGLAALSVPDRATVANMAPEYGATTGFFPIDGATLDYLELTGRGRWAPLVRAYGEAQGLLADGPDPEYDRRVDIDLGAIGPALAGPGRPQDRVDLADLPGSFQRSLGPNPAPSGGPEGEQRVVAGGREFMLRDGSIVIAAITSCTNTSNPSVMIGAGLLARNAVARGLRVPPQVKTSLAPGSRAVTGYLRAAGLMAPLEQLGFHVVGYGCTTCIGNSGPLDPAIEAAIATGGLSVAAVLSGNRNFPARIHPSVRANYLASPPLVVALALAGRIDIDLTREPIGTGSDGRSVFLRDLWPDAAEIAERIARTVDRERFRRAYRGITGGDSTWRDLVGGAGLRYAWNADSTYIRRPPFLDNLRGEPMPPAPIAGARALLVLGDSVTTDHISPAGAIGPESPAGRHLSGRGVPREAFNSYGSRRGNHEVMVRGTFANPRLRNRLIEPREGGVTRVFPAGGETTVYEAAEAYRRDRVPLVVLAGREYGTGSSRDWAAKGPGLLGVRAVIAESFERIHRSNLIGMGILPLQFGVGESAASLGLRGDETYTLGELDALGVSRELEVHAETPDGRTVRFTARVRLDTKAEMECYRQGGILPLVVRTLARGDV